MKNNPNIGSTNSRMHKQRIEGDRHRRTPSRPSNRRRRSPTDTRTIIRISDPRSLCLARPSSPPEPPTPRMATVKDYGEATLSQNKIFDPIKPETTAVIDHGITTRRTGQLKTSRCRWMSRAVLCSRRRPSRPRVVRPSAPDAAPPRYPHVLGGSAVFRTARFTTTARRGRGAGGCSFIGGELGLT
jgi:hypothetical protein